MKKYRGYWYRKYSDLKLAEKMIIVYVMMLGICFLLSVVALQVSFNIYDGKLYEKSLQELDFFTQEVNRSLDEVEGISYNIAMDTKIQEQLSKMKSLKRFSADYSYEVYQLRMLFNNELANSNMISNMVYTDGDKTQFVVGIATGTISKELYDSVMDRIHEAKGAYVVQQPTCEYPYLLTGRDIRKHIDASLEYLGSLLITCDVSGMIEKYIDDLEAESSALCVYSDEGVIYENQEHMMERIPALENEKGYQVIKENGQRYFVCHLKSSKTGWTYVNVFPYSEIYGQNQKLRYLMIGGFLLLFLVTALILKKLAHMIVKPLEHLTESMQIVETGDFDRAREFIGNSSQKDEIGLMTQEFKVTLDKIDTLIHENYEKQLLLKDTKYKMLQAQINPHFLYNTLNSINWIAKKAGVKDISTIVQSLGSILQSTLNKKTITSIEEELTIVSCYVKIQQIRFDDLIIDMNIDSSTIDAEIPKMTIQPLVENAILHSQEEPQEEYLIRLSVTRENENLIKVQVENSGSFIDTKILEHLKENIVTPKGNGVGLLNIDSRLRIIFGDDYHLNFDNKNGMAIVSFTIPQKTDLSSSIL